MTSDTVQARKSVITGPKTLISASINATPKTSSPSSNVLIPVKDSAGKYSGGRKRRQKRRNKKGYEPVKDSEKKKTKTANVETTTATKTSPTVTGSNEAVKRARREPTKKEDLARSVEGVSENWKLSPPLGGRFLILDPVFARNEKYLLLAHAMSLKIYSTKTSLLVRNIQIPSTKSSERIVSYHLDPENDNWIYIATLTSHLFHWDWVEGKLVQRWSLGLSQLRFISICADEKPEADFVGTIYAASTIKGGALWRIKLPMTSKGPIEKSRIYDSPNDLPSAAQIMDGGNIVVIIAGRVLVIGNKYSEQEDNSEWGAYRKYPMNFQITCMDSYLPAEEGSKGMPKKGKKGKNADALGDVVVGNDTGAMHVFHNALRVKENSKKEPVIRALHWHRKKVRSVKWALDGNYIISGGSETVLVMWQIETGHKQFLPHLGSVIERMTVSPGDTSYAILLSDNSVMVLSTTELKPKTNIAGIQCRVFPPRETKQIKVPCALHPTTANRLLVATPSSQLYDNTSSPYLQIFDTYSDRHVSRQALTRTNATNFNSGPEQNMILEPNVSQIAVTADGEWLATVDEWKPPRREADWPGSGDSSSIEERGYGREVYLRFWKWSEKRKLWEPVTRVDSPHPLASGIGAEEVFDLIPSPKGHGFATIGADGSVRIWRTKTRTCAGGTQVRNAEGGLTSWGCRRIIIFSRGKKEIEHPMLTFLDALSKGSKCCYWGQLAFSEDGSIVAIATPVLGLGSVREDSIVHIADSDAGVVRQSVGGLQLGRIHGVGILERYLIILGSLKLLVWNLVNNKVQWEFPFESLELSSKIGGHLAVDHHSQTFAAALSPKKSNDKQRLYVFDVSSIVPVHVQEVSPVRITALKSSEGGKGYMVLDAEANIQYISPILAHHVSVPHLASSTEFSLESDGETSKDIGVWLSGVYLTNNTTPDNDEPERMDEDDDGVVEHVIPREALEGIFDAVPPYTARTVEAFEKVLVLFAKKPLGLDDKDVFENDENDEDMGMQMVVV